MSSVLPKETTFLTNLKMAEMEIFKETIVPGNSNLCVDLDLSPK